MGVKGLLSPPQGHPLQRDIPGVGVKGQDWWARPPRGSQAALLASTHSTRAARRVYGTICLTKHRCLFKEKKKHSWTLFPPAPPALHGVWEGVKVSPVWSGDARAGCLWGWHILAH